MAEYNSAGALQRRYVHRDTVDEPWVHYIGSSIQSANRRYLHADHQGSIIAHSDSSGNVLSTLAYDSHGIPMAKNTRVPGAFGYTGQVVFRELGLNYYKARFYHPKLGRFLQTDPIGYKDDMNLYAYVGNDPVNKTDPTGLSCEQNEKGAVTSCKIDKGGEKLEKGAREGFEKRMAGLANKLIDKKVASTQITLKGPGVRVSPQVMAPWEEQSSIERSFTIQTKRAQQQGQGTRPDQNCKLFMVAML